MTTLKNCHCWDFIVLKSWEEITNVTAAIIYMLVFTNRCFAFNVKTNAWDISKWILTCFINFLVIHHIYHMLPIEEGGTNEEKMNFSFQMAHQRASNILILEKPLFLSKITVFEMQTKRPFWWVLLLFQRSFQAQNLDGNNAFSYWWLTLDLILMHMSTVLKGTHQLI